MDRDKIIVKAMWWLYAAALLIFVSAKFDGSLSALSKRLFQGPAHFNLEPFKTFRLQWKYFFTRWGYRNMLGNLLPFMPLGVLPALAYPRLSSPRRRFGTALLFILGLELFQLITRLGSFDVDDILLNTLGAALGFGIEILARGPGHNTRT